MLVVIQGADETPTSQAIEAVNKLNERTQEMSKWKTLSFKT